MHAWTPAVAEPFRSDERFWSSVAASMDAFLALVVSVTVFAVVGGWSAAMFVAPAALLARAARHGRASSARTRPTFASKQDWRDAERQAVATAMRGALTRPRLRRGR
jgi:hypothetical protein